MVQCEACRDRSTTKHRHEKHVEGDRINGRSENEIFEGILETRKLCGKE